MKKKNIKAISHFSENKLDTNVVKSVKKMSLDLR